MGLLWAWCATYGGEGEGKITMLFHYFDTIVEAVEDRKLRSLRVVAPRRLPTAWRFTLAGPILLAFSFFII